MCVCAHISRYQGMKAHLLPFYNIGLHSEMEVVALSSYTYIKHIYHLN